MIKKLISIFCTAFLCCGSVFGQTDAKDKKAVDVLFQIVEKNLISAAEAMPADKYSFAPTGGEFHGVRIFGEQVKHAAATNYILAAAALGEEAPADAGDEEGPNSIHTKPEIVQYLKGSFAELHKAVERLDEKN